MKTIRRFAIASVALALGLPAVAQNADTSATAPTGQSFRATPSRTVHNNNGSAKAVLAPYGAYITQVGVGAGGNDVSEIEPGFNTYGYGMQGGTINNHIADDFVVTGAGWTVSNYKWLTYQSNAPTTGTITAMYLNLWNTDPLLGGTPIITGGNQLTSQVFTGVYRVTSATLLSTARGIIETDNAGAWAAALTPGTYWLDASADGSTSFSGPWCPVVTPSTPADNARQFIGSSGIWQAVIDGVANLPQGALFQVEGSGGGGPPTFCTATPSSLAGCTSNLSGTGATVSKSGGPGSYTLTAQPAPGGTQAGIFLWAKSQLATPVLAPFGWRCIPVTRGTPRLAGGTPGQCNGAYNWDVGAYVTNTAGIAINDNLSFQGWYRDPGLTVGALFTDGVGPVPVVP